MNRALQNLTYKRIINGEPASRQAGSNLFPLKNKMITDEPSISKFDI